MLMLLHVCEVTWQTVWQLRWDAGCLLLLTEQACQAADAKRGLTQAGAEVSVICHAWLTWRESIKWRTRAIVHLLSQKRLGLHAKCHASGGETSAGVRPGPPATGADGCGCPKRHLIPGHCPLDFNWLVMQGFPDPTCQDKVNSLFAVKADEAEASGPFVVVIIHDNSILNCAELFEVPAGTQSI